VARRFLPAETAARTGTGVRRQGADQHRGQRHLLWHDEAHDLRDLGGADPGRFRVRAQGTPLRRQPQDPGRRRPSIDRFIASGIDALGDKLGPILWQFAATKKFEAEDFAAFVALLPSHIGERRLRHALEVRHPSFAVPAFTKLAREAGAAIVHADSDTHPCIDEATADFTYARLQRSVETVETGYDAAALDGWADTARSWAHGGRDAFVYFISGAKVRNPAAAQALIARLS